MSDTAREQAETAFKDTWEKAGLDDVIAIVLDLAEGYQRHDAGGPWSALATSLLQDLGPRAVAWREHIATLGAAHTPANEERA